MKTSLNAWLTRFTGFVVSLLIIALVTCFTSNSAESKVNPDRLQKLSQGTNLPFWLWIGRDNLQELDQRYPDEYFKIIQSLGLKHVRVPIDMANVYDKTSENLLNDRVLQILDRGVRKIVDEYRLGVIIDLHSINQSAGGSNYSGQLDSDAEFVEEFIKFWASFAKHLSQYDPEWVFLEPMNEPVFRNKEDQWPPIQKRVIATIRENAPEHTIFATGAQWSNINSFVKLEPLDDDNIVYNFHFYEPHLFTHQGASWSSDVVKTLKDIPYPSSPEIMQDVIKRYDSEDVQAALKRYGDQRWNEEKILEEFKKAYDWGQKYNVPLQCNEFGVYHRVSPRDSLVRWVEDVHKAFEKYNIGWTMWSGSFGILDQRGGEIILHKDIAKALGLKLDE